MSVWHGRLAAVTVLAMASLAPQGVRAGIAAPDTSMEAAVLAEINMARTHPAEYARRLRRFRAFYHGRLVQEPGARVDVETVEGRAAADEAIAFLARQRPLPPLTEDGRLDDAAMGFADQAGPAGVFGHVGPDGSTMIQRIRDAGVWPRVAGEDIAYGPDTAEAVVRGLIIDDGVPGRGHRTAIFNPSYRVAGAGCGPHTRYRIMCVIDFAGQMTAPP